jgi:hypothetical protein
LHLGAGTVAIELNAGGFNDCGASRHLDFVRLILAHRVPVLLIISGVFCSVTVGRYVLIVYGPGSWGPQFACAESCFDFGSVSRGQVVEHEFLIENTGRQALQILEASSECGGCLSLKVRQTEILPGGRSTVNVALKTARLKKTGEFKKRLLLRTNDGYRPDVILCISGMLLDNETGLAQKHR